MANPEELIGKVLEGSIVPVILAIIGYLGGRRQGITQERAAKEQRMQAGEESEDRRETREIELALEQINEVRTWWTVELAQARKDLAENQIQARKDLAENQARYNILWRWAANLTAKWNNQHPDDPCEMPNGQPPAGAPAA
jgi:hypothetical protein